MRFIGQIRQETNPNQPASQVGLNWFGFSIGIDRYLMTLALFALASAASAESTVAEADQQAAFETAAIEATQQLVNSPLQPIPDYSGNSDNELTRLGARWDRLSAPERQALLKEVKLRMAQRKDADGVLMIRTQRRYGRVYSNGSGRYLKIETKVIRVRPAGSGSAASATSGFGVGFEKRNSSPKPAELPAQEAERSAPPLDAAMSPPVVRVKDPSS